MTHEELKALISEAVDAKIAPLMQTERKYNVGDVPEGSQEQQKGEKVEPGIRFARMAKLLVLGKNDPEKALFYAKGPEGASTKGMYPNDTVLHEKLKALSVTTPSEGGFLVPEILGDEIIPLLYAKTAVMELGARRIPMPNGNMNMPKITGGATAYYQGENLPATKSQPKFGNVKLSSKKMITLVPTSNDLIRNSSLAADMIIRDDMIRQMQLKMDYTAMYGAGTEFTPIGIKNVPGVDASAVSAVITADDPGTMLGILMSKNLPMTSVGWIFNGTMWAVLYNLKTTTGAYIYRAEMDQGKLLGYPFVISNQIPGAGGTHNESDIFLGDFSEFMMGEEIAFEMMASQEATYDNGSGTLVSAFSNDQTVIKVLAKHDFNVRHAEAFVVRNYYTK